MIEVYYKLTKQILIFTGFRYWYNIKFQYINKCGNEVFYRIIQIGLDDKRDILNLRMLKQFAFCKNGLSNAKHIMDNGSLKITSIEYLGLIIKK